jgi:hypothetical protein
VRRIVILLSRLIGDGGILEAMATPLLFNPLAADFSEVVREAIGLEIELPEVNDIDLG